MKLIECPRDAWQGVPEFIETVRKAAYVNTLLRVGFDTIDVGSFVSAKVMPQVRDTAELLSKLDLTPDGTRLLAIVANERGAEDACRFNEISYLGYPFSISETFQYRNTNAGIAGSLERVKRITELCFANRKELVIYISMGFGNPYGDPWDETLVETWVYRLKSFGIRIFSLSDTVGVAETSRIRNLFRQFTTNYPELEFGAHFHSRPEDWRTKIETAYDAGCRRFDGAVLGYGGCPMAQDDLVGNIATENLVAFAEEKGGVSTFNKAALAEARVQFSALVNHLN